MCERSFDAGDALLLIAAYLVTRSLGKNCWRNDYVINTEVSVSWERVSAYWGLGWEAELVKY
jgi:hypothetical protein